MSNSLSVFERFARSAKNLGSRGPSSDTREVHPFDERNIHPEISDVSLKLFDNGHYSQATFEALKLLDQKVKAASGVNDSGFGLMMAAFNEKNPKIKLTELSTTSEIDEQLGFRHMFAGSMSAIRNPRGHELIADTIDLCLDHLSLASVLMRTFDNRKGNTRRSTVA
jgi:uncharacterized protein (TIGR02391 family)